jgi:predicted ATPase/DNA-binding XRE family transcriptional regulator
MQEEISFGTWLRKQRKSLDLSQQAFADQLGCAEVTLRRIEAGRLKPSRELANILFEKLGIPETERQQWISFARGLSGFPLFSTASANGQITNLPVPLTSFIGREREQSEVIRLISKHRLVTLTGAGGVGKTRLAIQVVADLRNRFPDGVWFLDLASLIDPALVPNTLAGMVGLRESTELTPTNLLINYFRSRTALVIFDNCEHVIESCSQLVHSLLSICENLSILATSREALRVAGEIAHSVPSLEIPRLGAELTTDTLREFEALRLFAERGAVALPGFLINSHNALIVARICDRLDGIPLAIELAAARVNVLTVEQILTRLNEQFNLLTGGLRSALPRHQTLHAAMEWSYNLLSEKEQIVFRRLAVFSGGWILEAAEIVCSGNGIDAIEVLDLLSHLVNKSLVYVETVQGQIRYRRLKMIRDHALAMLKRSNEMRVVCRRHLTYFAELVYEAERNFKGPDEASWYGRLDTELDNVRVALTWFGGLEYVDERLRFAAGLWRYWKNRGKTTEGRGHIQHILDSLPLGPSRRTAACARALTAVGALAYYEADFSFSEQSRKEALSIYRILDDKAGIADCLNGLGNAAISQGNYNEARTFYEESLVIRQELEDKWGVARIIGNLGLLAYFQGNYDQAYSFHMESLILFRELQDYEGIANELINLGDVARYQGKLSIALALYGESISISKSLQDQWGLPYGIMGLADVAFEQGDFSAASSQYKDSLIMFQKAADYIAIPYLLESIAALLFVKNQLEAAARIYGSADALRKRKHSPLPLPNQSAYQKYLSLLKQQLGMTKFEIAWTEGFKMTSDQAAALALSCIDDAQIS